MEEEKKFSIFNKIISSFSPGSSGRKAAQEYKTNEDKKNAEIVFEYIADRLVRGETVRVENFGTFDVRQRKAPEARSPRTGEKKSVQVKNTPVFRADKKLKEKLKS